MFSSSIEKKMNEKKNAEPEMATAHLSIRLGSGGRWAQVEARRALREQAQSFGALHDAGVRLGARGEQAAGGRWAQAQARGAGACGSRRTGARSTCGNKRMGVRSARGTGLGAPVRA